MSQFLISLFGFILAVGILITVHEFGHFWVARRFGIKVERFSIGFGRPLLRWYDKLGTEYVIALIPLGGYVSMLGEREVPMSDSERPMAYNHKPVIVRMAVLLAGPGFNLLFAVLVYWYLFFSGILIVSPILGVVPEGSVAQIAGLKKGQEIVAIEGKETQSWDDVRAALFNHLGEEQPITIQVRDKNHKEVESRLLDVSQSAEIQDKKDVLEELGLFPLDPIPPIVANLVPAHPAEKAGFKVADRIIAVDGHREISRSELSQYIQSHAGDKITFTVVRNDKTITIPVTPLVRRLDDGKAIGFVGIEYQVPESFPQEWMRVEKYGVWDSLVKAVQRTRDYSFLTFKMIKKIIVGAVSSDLISGPITIAKYAGQTVSYGLEYFLSFLATISISLAVFNLLPIPALDGGHFVYCVWEAITGRPVSQQVQMVGIWIGVLLIMSVTLLAIYNDLMNF